MVFCFRHGYRTQKPSTLTVLQKRVFQFILYRICRTLPCKHCLRDIYFVQMFPCVSFNHLMAFDLVISSIFSLVRRFMTVHWIFRHTSAQLCPHHFQLSFFYTFAWPIYRHRTAWRHCQHPKLGLSQWYLFKQLPTRFHSLHHSFHLSSKNISITPSSMASSIIDISTSSEA